jgi:hypothetical protein
MDLGSLVQSASSNGRTDPASAALAIVRDRLGAFRLDLPDPVTSGKRRAIRRTRFRDGR